MLVLTGSPGVGKTTVFLKAVEILRAQGYSVGGMVSREVRKEGIRVGFEVEDLARGRKDWLAQVGVGSGPHVGKYRVNLRGLDNIGAAAILDALSHKDVAAIDEIGPMELFSEKFKKAARKALNSEKVLLVVVHRRAQDSLVVGAKSREDTEIFVVTLYNRDALPSNVAFQAIKFLERCG